MIQKKKYRMPQKAKITIALWAVSAIIGAITMMAFGLIIQAMAGDKKMVDDQELKVVTVEAPNDAYNARMHRLEKRVNLLSLVIAKKSMVALASDTKPEQVVEIVEEPEEVEEVPETILYSFLATGYSSAWEENGGYGAVDCKYGQPLPANAIAADLSVLPYGTRVYIQGFGEKIVVDTASKATITRTQAMADKRGCTGWIDIYFGDDVQQASDWGVQVVTLEILEWGDGR